MWLTCPPFESANLGSLCSALGPSLTGSHIPQMSDQIGRCVGGWLKKMHALSGHFRFFHLSLEGSIGLIRGVVPVSGRLRVRRTGLSDPLDLRSRKTM